MKTCPQCGDALVGTRRRFCSDERKIRWWNLNRGDGLTCRSCGKAMYQSATSKPQGDAECRPCRRVGAAVRVAAESELRPHHAACQRAYYVQASKATPPPSRPWAPDPLTIHDTAFAASVRAVVATAGPAFAHDAVRFCRRCDLPFESITNSSRHCVLCRDFFRAVRSRRGRGAVKS